MPGDMETSVSTYAASGAAVGSVIPGIGTAVGAVVGAVVGAAYGSTIGYAKARAKMHMKKSKLAERSIMQSAAGRQRRQGIKNYRQARAHNTAMMYAEAGGNLSSPGLAATSSYLAQWADMMNQSDWMIERQAFSDKHRKRASRDLKTVNDLASMWNAGTSLVSTAFGAFGASQANKAAELGAMQTQAQTNLQAYQNQSRNFSLPQAMTYPNFTYGGG